MAAVPSPVPGSAGLGPAQASLFGSWRGRALQCLHFLTCRICDPPPEVPDSARLGIAVMMFGGSAALLVGALSSQLASLSYCALGLARLLPQRGKSFAMVGGVAGAAWLLLLCLPGAWAVWVLVSLVAISELCWLMTLRRVLDEEFDVFVAVLFLFLGVQLTFGFYPLLMRWGPPLLKSPEVHHTVQQVVSRAVEAGGHAGPGPAVSGQPSVPLDGSVAPGAPGLEESSDAGPMVVFSQLLPLLALLVGVPGLAFAVLVSCWMFEHMSRMVLAVVVSFLSWMALYAALSFLRVPVSRDLFGKAILASACVLMYHAFSRLTCLDGRAAQARLTWLGGAFAAIFGLDRLVALSGVHCNPLLLFAVLVACKLTYSTWANFLEAECEGPLLQVKHLTPFRSSVLGEAPGGAAGEGELDSSVDEAQQSARAPLRGQGYI